MDTLTHALSGALAGRALTRGKPGGLTVRQALAGGFLAAAFPDSDYLLAFFVDPLAFINAHRGATHSLPLLPLWALLLALLLSLLWRRPVAVRQWYPLVALALLIHISADVITSYGTRVLTPFSDYRAAVPTTFIIDPWFTGILLAGLLASWVWRRSRLPAVAAISAVVLYVGMQAVLMHEAESLGRAYARAAGLGGARVDALAQPLSPFNWKVLVADADGYRVGLVNLARSLPPSDAGPGASLFERISSLYRPPDHVEWRRVSQFGGPGESGFARAAWSQPVMAGYREFARYPYLSGLSRWQGGTCAWFADLRFSLAAVRVPFEYGACQNGASWRLYRKGESGPAPAVRN